MSENNGLHVLWSTDGSPPSHAAIPLLRQVIMPAASELSVLTVLPHSPLAGARPDPAFLSRTSATTRRRALHEGEQQARDEATLLDPAVEVHALSRWGNPIVEILRAARSQAADLVVLGAKGHSDLSILLLGSVAQGVVQHATLPVLVVRPGAGDVRRIIAAYDGTAQARRGVDFLRRLSLPSDATLTLSYVVEPYVPSRLTPSSARRRAAQEAERVLERHVISAEQALTALKLELEASGLKVDTEVLRGTAGKALEQSARRRRADLVVVGSRKPSPSRQYLLGSTAESLVRHSHSSVLVVR